MQKKQQSNFDKVIIGIDPGFADTGYGVIKVADQSRLECIAYGSIKTPAGIPLPDRLFFINERLNDLIIKHKPQLFAIEELFFYNNAKTAINVGQARGVAILAAKQNGLPITEFTPLQVKQAVASYGKADKKQVQRMVKMILCLNEIPKPDDAADALAVAICAVNELSRLKHN